MFYFVLLLVSFLCGCGQRSIENFHNYSVNSKIKLQSKIRKNLSKIYTIDSNNTSKKSKKNRKNVPHSKSYDKSLRGENFDEVFIVRDGENEQVVNMSSHTVSKKVISHKLKTHKVVIGETIGVIAHYHDINALDIVNANKIQEPYVILPGQILNIPLKKNQKKDRKLVEKELKIFKEVDMNFSKEYYPWDYDLLDTFDVSLILKFRDDMKKITKFLSKKFVDSIELDQKSDGIFLRFMKKKIQSSDDQRKFAVEYKNGFAEKKIAKKIYVHSMTSGKIVMVSKTEEFGTIAVVDSGGGKFIIYGYLQSVFVKTGDFVKIGSSFASVGTGIFNDPVLFLGVYKIEKGKRIFLDPTRCFDYLGRFF